eukprot:CCRYP_006534-RA/>CCRYP_006534-RA protein AED:0.59 eAED:0.48 QI:0/0/0/1/0/0/2/0/122
MGVTIIYHWKTRRNSTSPKPFPLPKISTVLQELEGFTYATTLDLNMGYYTIRLDPDSSKICTLIFPWGKYSYLRLPMGIARFTRHLSSKNVNTNGSLRVRCELTLMICCASQRQTWKTTLTN